MKAQECAKKTNTITLSHNMSFVVNYFRINAWLALNYGRLSTIRCKHDIKRHDLSRTKNV